MSQTWQPARLAFAHGINSEDLSFIGMEKMQMMATKVVRVRPYPARKIYLPDLLRLQSLGCDASKFYEIHPDDLVTPTQGSWICEHEVVTD
jgi:hypothetical protein